MLKPFLVAIACGLLVAGCDDPDAAPTSPSAAPSRLTLSAAAPGHTLLSGSSLRIAARVTTEDGAALAGVPVEFSTTTGTLAIAIGRTNESGEASAVLTASDTATVRASAGGRDAAPLTVASLAPFRVSVAPAMTPVVVGMRDMIVTVTGLVSAPPVTSSLTLTCGAAGAVSIQPPSPTPTPIVTHPCTFPSAGSYTVSAAASTANGWSTSGSTTIEVSAAPAAPGTSPTPSPAPTITISSGEVTRGTGYAEWRFGSSSNTAMQQFVFDFGDGHAATHVPGGARVTGQEQHLYTAAGSYTVRVTGTPANGRAEVSASTTITVQVNP